jgi:hypothetical protein
MRNGGSSPHGESKTIVEVALDAVAVVPVIGSPASVEE